MVVLGKILIMDLELRTEVLRDASRELETLRMASVKQELAMLEGMTGATLEDIWGVYHIITDDLLEDSYSASYMPATNQQKEDWL